jgi:hypothetical protein
MAEKVLAKIALAKIRLKAFSSSKKKKKKKKKKYNNLRTKQTKNEEKKRSKNTFCSIVKCEDGEAKA